MRARDTGIITERDVLRALGRAGRRRARPGRSAQFASRPLVTLPAAAFVYRALGRMSRLKLRHLGVENENGEICGIVTSRDLLRLRAQEASILGDGLDQADDVPALAAAWARLPQAAAGLIAEGVSGRDIAAVISRELGALTRRAGVLAERRMKAEGQGEPPAPYALCVLGSAGRGESLLAMDQDNAIVFAEGEPGGAADRWFAQLGAIVADILHEVGVPYCDGGVMGRNAAWRGSMATWRARVADWIARSRPDDLVSVDIFFDLVGVHGDAALARSCGAPRFDAARGNAAFAKLLAEAAGEVPPGLTLWGGLRTENGRIDLKRRACSASSAPRACWRSAITCSSARRRRGLPPSPRSAAAAARPRRAGARAGAVPRSHSRSAARRHASRPAAEQQGRGQAADPRSAHRACARRSAPCATSMRSRAICCSEPRI